MDDKYKIIQAITDFVKGGDESNLELLNKVLHDDFRLTNNGFMGTDGVTIINKKKYITNVKKGVFGGHPRTMTIENIDESTTIAIVKLKLQSTENHFISYNSMVLNSENEWQIIANLAVVEEIAK